jgi:electron transport complex protein RnfE
MGAGFCIALVIIGVIRELLGSGTVFGMHVMGSWYNPALIMILPPGAFILIGYLVAIVKVYNQHQEKLKMSRGDM